MQKRKKQVQPETPVVSANEWKEKGNPTRKLILPSGVCVIIKQARLLDYVMSGYIPLYAFQEIKTISENLEDPKNNLNVPPEDMNKLKGWMDKVAILSCVNPKVVAENPGDDEICVADIPFEDKLEIFNNIMQEGRSLLRSFRLQ